MDNRILNKPKAYRGEEPYIFISYSHQDSAEVYEVIRKLQTQGYRVWYDESIRSGANWQHVIIDKIKDCACYIAFITEDYMKSPECQKEMLFAERKCNKSNIAIVYLKEILDEAINDVVLFRYGLIQGIYKYKYQENEEIFYEYLYDTKGMKECLGSPSFECDDPFYDPFYDPANWSFMEEEEYKDYLEYEEDVYKLHTFPESWGIEADIPMPTPNPISIGGDSTKQVIEWCGEMAEVFVRNGDVCMRDIEECIAYMKHARFHNKNLPAGHKFRVMSTFVDRNSPCSVVHIEYWHDVHMEPIFDEGDVRHIFYDNWEFVNGVVYNVFAYIGSEDMHLESYL